MCFYPNSLTKIWQARKNSRISNFFIRSAEGKPQSLVYLLFLFSNFILHTVEVQYVLFCTYSSYPEVVVVHSSLWNAISQCSQLHILYK